MPTRTPLIRTLLPLAAAALGACHAAAQTPAVTPISQIRAQVDPVNLIPPASDQLYTAEGIVTTHVNLTTANSGLFYFQDETGGLAVFHTGAAGVVPPAGARVRVTGPLIHFNGLLELGPNVNNTATGVEIISTNNPVPAPVEFDFAWIGNPVQMEANEGRLVAIREVEIDRSTGENFPNGGANVNITSRGGQVFTLRVDARVTGMLGQPKPAGFVDIIGVLAQFDTSNPRDTGYQIIPSRYADIITPLKPASVAFTNHLSNLVRPGDAPVNSFTEHAVRPGESLRTEAVVTDSDGRNITITPLATGLPSGGTWNFSALSGTTVTATFTYTGDLADAGRLFTVGFDANNGSAVNQARWTVYVPTEAEQQVVITEFYANPTGSSTNAHFNPLARAEIPAESITLFDEFIEIVNLSGGTVDFLNWSYADSLSVRHRFYSPTPLVSSNALVVYGGPLNGFLPTLPAGVYSEPASEGAGIALNNAGDTLVLRNAAGNLVSRIVYGEADTAPDGSVHRAPGARGAFRAHRSVSSAAWSPGTQPDGRAWTEPQPVGPDPQPPFDVAATLAADGTLTLTWPVVAGRTYTVKRSESLDGGYTAIASGLTAGTLSVPAGGSAGFFRVETPE